MALPSRLWRLLPLRRGATQSFRQLARTWGSRGHCGSEVIRNTRPFKRGLLFSALSFLGFETYQVISRAAVVHATAKVEEILEQADYLYESGETEKLYQLLTQYKESEDAELLWRLARASRDIAQLSRTSEEEKKVLVYEALEYAKRALEKNESSFAAHKWYAICISDVGDYEGIKVKIANAYIIKEHFQCPHIWRSDSMRDLSKFLMIQFNSISYLLSRTGLEILSQGRTSGSKLLQQKLAAVRKDIFETKQQKACCFLAGKSQGLSSTHRRR
uniref:regulator of microtubule dynamics protein 1 isoform X2 n=1 Tax=Myodes glareolus TaxID=447135 RepID=UPI002021FD68|nr:regulator of microtubule dynamics protein 1 isoform X2 [Myodes glareolus]